MKNLTSIALLFISFSTWGGDSCPQYWVPSISTFEQIVATPLDKVDLRTAADIVLDPQTRPELLKDNNDCGELAWFETRRLEGYLDMYLATKDESYLQGFVEMADKIYDANDFVTKRKDELRGKKVVFGWSSIKYTANGQRHVQGVQSGIFAENYARFSRIVWENKATRFSGKASEYYSIAAKTLNAVIEDWDPKLGFFRFKPKATPKHEIYPYNQGLALGSAYIEFYNIHLMNKDLVNAAKMKTMAEKIGYYFKNALEYDSKKDRYLWKYAPGSYYEDMSHASIDFNFIKKAHDSKLLFSAQDMRRFGNTIEGAYLPKEKTFARYMDGKQLEGYTHWYGLTCLIVTDFSQYSTNKTIIKNCESSVSKIITNANVLKDIDRQYLGLIVNGIPKLFRSKLAK